MRSTIEIKYLGMGVWAVIDRSSGRAKMSQYPSKKDAIEALQLKMAKLEQEAPKSELEQSMAKNHGLKWSAVLGCWTQLDDDEA